MGTRSMVIKEEILTNKDGKKFLRLTGACIHWDGYIDGVGKALFKNIKNDKDLEETNIFNPATGYIDSLDQETGKVNSSEKDPRYKNIFIKDFDDDNKDWWYSSNYSRNKAISQFFNEYVDDSDAEYVYFFRSFEGTNEKTWMVSKYDYVNEGVHSPWTKFIPVDHALWAEGAVKALSCEAIKTMNLKLSFDNKRLDELFNKELIYNWQLKQLFIPDEEDRKLYREDDDFIRMLQSNPLRFFKSKDEVEYVFTSKLEQWNKDAIRHEERIKQFEEEEKKRQAEEAKKPEEKVEDPKATKEVKEMPQDFYDAMAYADKVLNQEEEDKVDTFDPDDVTLC